MELSRKYGYVGSIDLPVVGALLFPLPRIEASVEQKLSCTRLNLACVCEFSAKVEVGIISMGLCLHCVAAIFNSHTQLLE